MIKMVSKILLSVMLLLFFLSCGQKRNLKIVESKEPTSINSSDINDTLMQYAEDWRKDSLGCLKLRTSVKAGAIIKGLNRSSISMQMLNLNFGQPNDVQIISGNRKILVYYFDTLCRDGELIKEADKCYAKFYIEGDFLQETDFICE